LPGKKNSLSSRTDGRRKKGNKDSLSIPGEAGDETRTTPAIKGRTRIRGKV